MTTSYLPPIVAAGVIIDSLGREWDPLKHPRGRDGQFIHVFKRILAFLSPDDTDPWMAGEVTHLNDDGTIRVRITKTTDPNLVDPSTNKPYVGAQVDITPDRMESINEKAVLDLDGNDTPAAPVKKANAIAAYGYGGETTTWNSFKNRFFPEMKTVPGQVDFNNSVYQLFDTLNSGGTIEEYDNRMKAMGGHDYVRDATKYAVALRMRAESDDIPDTPGASVENAKTNDQFRAALAQLGVPENIIDDTPDGLSGVAHLAEPVRAWHNEESGLDVAPTYPGAIREQEYGQNKKRVAFLGPLFGGNDQTPTTFRVLDANGNDDGKEYTNIAEARKAALADDTSKKEKSYFESPVGKGSNLDADGNRINPLLDDDGLHIPIKGQKKKNEPQPPPEPDELDDTDPFDENAEPTADDIEEIEAEEVADLADIDTTSVREIGTELENSESEFGETYNQSITGIANGVEEKTYTVEEARAELRSLAGEIGDEADDTDSPELLALSKKLRAAADNLGVTQKADLDEVKVEEQEEEGVTPDEYWTDVFDGIGTGVFDDSEYVETIKSDLNDVIAVEEDQDGISTSVVQVQTDGQDVLFDVAMTDNSGILARGRFRLSRANDGSRLISVDGIEDFDNPELDNDLRNSVNPFADAEGFTHVDAVQDDDSPEIDQNYSDSAFLPYSEEQFKTIKSYIGTGAARVNKSLRKYGSKEAIPENVDADEFFVMGTETPTIEMIDIMDGALDVAPEMQHEKKYYRGIDTMPMTSEQRKAFIAQFVPGAIIRDKGYLSITSDRDIAEHFSMKNTSGHEPIVIALNVPEGQRGIDIDGNHALETGESEFILPRDVPIVVDDVQLIDGVHRVTAHIDPNAVDVPETEKPVLKTYDDNEIQKGTPFTNAQMDAFDYYTSTGANWLNSKLRSADGLENIPEGDYHDDWDGAVDTHSFVNALDGGIEASDELSPDDKLYRGLYLGNDDTGAKEKIRNGLKPGGTLYDAGYMSTTRNESIALNNFAGEVPHDSVVFEITPGPGLKGFDIEGWGLSGGLEEEEVVLPRGVHLEYDDVQYRQNHIRVIARAVKDDDSNATTQEEEDTVTDGGAPSPVGGPDSGDTAGEEIPVDAGPGEDDTSEVDSGGADDLDAGPDSGGATEEAQEVTFVQYQETEFTVIDGEPLSWSEQEALDEYTGLGHVDINGYLRDKYNYDPFYQQLEVTQDYVEHLRDALQRSRTKKQMTVYRGLDGSPLSNEKWEALVASLHQSRVTDKAFISTSRNKDIARSFSGADHQGTTPDVNTGRAILFEIDVPEGYSALDTGIKYSEPNVGSEAEIILPDNTPLDVDEIIATDEGYVVKAHVVDPNAPAIDNDAVETDPVDVTPDDTDVDAPADPVDSLDEVLEASDGQKFEILDDPGTSGDGYYNNTVDNTKLWGKYGAAGVLVRNTDENGVERFLMVQRGPIVSTNKGKWQLPGGALNSNENDYQGTARELNEELQSPDGWLDDLTPVGEVNFEHPSGWHYNNIAADAPEMFEPTIDGTETGDAKWFTIEEIADLDLHPALEKNLDEIFGQFGSTEELDAAPTSTLTPDDDPELLDAQNNHGQGSQIIDASDWENVGGQGGSNLGGMFRDENGQEWYVKKGKSESHAKNEVLAANFYKEAGIKTADLQLADTPYNALGTASPRIPNAKNDLKQRLQDPEYKKKLAEGYAVDAWLANWDVAGLVYDNVMTDGEGDGVRVDPGGALMYRAQGAPKGYLFGNEVGELTTFHDSNNTGSKLFDDMTWAEKVESAKKVIAISPERISEMVDEMDFDPDEAAALKAKLIARRAYIETYFGLNQTTDVPNPDAKLPVDAPLTDEELDNLPHSYSPNQRYRMEINLANFKPFDDESPYNYLENVKIISDEMDSADPESGMPAYHYVVVEGSGKNLRTAYEALETDKSDEDFLNKLENVGSEEAFNPDVDPWADVAPTPAKPIGVDPDKQINVDPLADWEKELLGYPLDDDAPDASDFKPGPESEDWEAMVDDKGAYRWNQDNQRIYVGSKVVGADGIEMTISKFENNNKGVIALDADGKKRIRHRKKLKLVDPESSSPAEQTPEPSPEPDNVPEVSTPDSDSPDSVVPSNIEQIFDEYNHLWVEDSKLGELDPEAYTDPADMRTLADELDWKKNGLGSPSINYDPTLDQQYLDAAKELRAYADYIDGGIEDSVPDSSTTTPDADEHKIMEQIAWDGDALTIQSAIDTFKEQIVAGEYTKGDYIPLGDGYELHFDRINSNLEVHSVETGEILTVGDIEGSSFDNAWKIKNIISEHSGMGLEDDLDEPTPSLVTVGDEEELETTLAKFISSITTGTAMNGDQVDYGPYEITYDEETDTVTLKDVSNDETLLAIDPTVGNTTAVAMLTDAINTHMNGDDDEDSDITTGNGYPNGNAVGPGAPWHSGYQTFKNQVTVFHEAVTSNEIADDDYMDIGEGYRLSFNTDFQSFEVWDDDQMAVGTKKYSENVDELVDWIMDTADLHYAVKQEAADAKAAEEADAHDQNWLDNGVPNGMKFADGDFIGDNPGITGDLIAQFRDQIDMNTLPDGAYIDSGDYRLGYDTGELIVWNVVSGQVVYNEPVDNKSSYSHGEAIQLAVEADQAPLIPAVPAFNSVEELKTVNNIPKNFPGAKQALGPGASDYQIKQYRNAGFALTDAAGADVDSPEWNNYVNKAIYNLTAAGPLAAPKLEEVKKWRENSLNMHSTGAIANTDTNNLYLPDGYAHVNPANVKAIYQYTEFGDTTYAVVGNNGSVTYYYSNGFISGAGAGTTSEEILMNHPLWQPFSGSVGGVTDAPGPDLSKPHKMDVNGNPMFIGDKVHWLTKNKDMVVHKFENNDVGVILKDPVTGSKHAINRKKIKVLQSYSQTPTPAPNKSVPPQVNTSSSSISSKKFDPDPDSPWFGEDKKPDKPEMADVLNLEGTKLVDDEWMVKADANYKQRMKAKNPSWTEKDLSTSSTYHMYQAAQKGDTGQLASLLSMGRITQEMHDDALDQITKKNAAYHEALNKYQTDYEQWIKDNQAWRKANGMPVIHLKGMDEGTIKLGDSAAVNWANTNLPPGGLNANGKLSTAAKSAVDAQKSSNISGTLRQGKEKTLDPNWLAQHGGHIVNGMDSATLESPPLPHDFNVVRTFNPGGFINPATGKPFKDGDNLSVLAGTIQHDWGYAETSVGSLDAGATATYGSGRAIWAEIRLPAGLRVVNAIAEYPSERGIILERGIAYYIHSVDWDPVKNKWIVKAEVIPKDVNYDEFGHFINNNPFFD